jgi:uncharacterized protein YkwD
MTSMTRRGLLAGGSALLLLAACTPSGPIGSTSQAELSVGRIMEAINGVRRANGREPLSYNHKLAAAARRQADLMAARDTLSHDLGVTLRQRVTDAGYVGAVGENVAGGQKTLEAAIEGWLASPAHRSTLLSSKFTEFGLAAARVGEGRKSRYGTYWAFVAGGDFAAWL